MSAFRLALLLSLGVLAACAQGDLAEPPMPLGDFGLGLNVVVTDKMQMVPISRAATAEEWTEEMAQAIDARFGTDRYKGATLYNLGIAIEGYALAPPGIPVVAAPKSILVISANIWEDAKAKKLNPEAQQITVFEGLSGDTVIGTGLTRTKKQQMEALSFNAARRVEEWLLEHPEWFGMTQTELEAALLARETEITAQAATAKAANVAPPAVAAPDAAAPEAAAPDVAVSGAAAPDTSAPSSTAAKKAKSTPTDAS